ncbi:dihydrofolate reductase family protein [Mucilaginibacter auburnensis]|uniref:Dihydrofolate reductase n=1 Tax=Mucilaginibacter auburnensis TaxID=1457233 RepID=A0A2H9VN86_9SPHI|nr:dihydrofolate reductase family protein [Mucilaginibacter auburnensis]PJJ79791.1 dihydrofolate reductase [Mucilaginibacter auburnensis]
MRKLVASVNITLDGFIAGPNCELDWHFSRWTTEMADVQTSLLSNADTILLGRVTYNAMAAYWPNVSSNVSFPRQDLAFADLMNSRQKAVFSNTIDALVWPNSYKISGKLDREIFKLKQTPGRDIMVYGSSKLMIGLIKLGLIDHFALWVHPVVLGKGKPLFSKMNDVVNMQLVQVRKFSSGVVLTQYQTVV